jgi:protein TonB
MEIKKNKKADLESKRGVFFLTGLVVALLAAVYIIQIESVSIALTEKKDVVVTADLSESAPRTVAPKPEVKQQQKQVEEKQVIDLKNLEKIFLFDDGEIADPDDTEKGVGDFQEDGVVEIDVEDEGDIEIITGSVLGLSKIAVPMECADIRDNQERKECLNQWIVKYISKEAKFPNRLRGMSDGERVYISFMIDEHGKVVDVKSVRGENQQLVKEALRVVKSMPDFDPAAQGAKKARMTMTVPVNFKLY